MVMGIDQKTRRISLSIKEAMIKKRTSEDEEGFKKARLEVGQSVRGIVEDIKPYGIFVRLPQLGAKVRGLLPLEELRDSEKVDAKRKFPRGMEIQSEIVSIDEKGRIRLSQKIVEEKRDQEEYKKFLEKEDQEGKFGTLGDILKNLKL
jgi:ribosomal protein S1